MNSIAKVTAANVSQQLLYELARTDFLLFVEIMFPIVCPDTSYRPAQYIAVIAHWLEEMEAGREPRLNINLPPRYLKSVICSVLFPAWVLGRNPAARIICISYSSELTNYHSNDFRRVIRSKRYREMFPGTKVSRLKDSETEVATTKGGYRFATSLFGTLTGRGGQYIIIDDPIKPEDAASDLALAHVANWVRSTLMSRLDDKRTGRMLLTMQRLHVEDLAGYFEQQSGWRTVKFSAIAEIDEEYPVKGGLTWSRKVDEVLHADREPRETLDLLREQMGTTHFYAQYQQCPVPAEGNLIKTAWIQFYDILPESQDYTVFMACDTACKTGNANDYSVLVTARRYGDVYYIVDLVRDRWDFPSLKRAIEAQARRHSPQYIFVEDAASGIQIIQDFRAGTGIQVIGCKVTGEKQARVYAQEGMFESGKIRFPRHAPWMATLMPEILGYPNVRHDDQIDAIVLLLAEAERRKARRLPALLGVVSVDGSGLSCSSRSCASPTASMRDYAVGLPKRS